MVIVTRYTSDQESEWNQFLSTAKNRHFFFNRKYMEYHADRFGDFSLVARDGKGKICALLPANLDCNTLYSHQGLTYGGFIAGAGMKTEVMLEIFDVTRELLEAEGIERLVYKAMPHIFHSLPAEEDQYALFRNNATLFRRDVTATIAMANRPAYQERRKRSIKKARKTGLVVEKSTDFKAYWAVLKSTLQSHHQVNAVHSISEIEHLACLFPDNIKLYTAKESGEVQAGTVIFENEHLVHTQYLASSEEGRAMGALDLVIDHLIQDVYATKAWFDFGISTEDGGRFLNTGLMAQKEGFGARAVVHDSYVLTI